MLTADSGCLGDSVADDEAAMAAALTAGRLARLRSSPNPWVGAVLIADRLIVGIGSTQPPGGAHAERVAMNMAGKLAVGSTLVTTLEPCSHEGRTGSCAEAIIEAGVQRVVVGVKDPDSQVAGRGIERLLAAGLEVQVGVLSEEVEADLAPYLHQRSTGRPYVVLKMAMTLDGYTAAPDGSSRWITGPAARADVHRLRAESDAVCVGSATVRSDDPQLNVRDLHNATELGARDPRRIVLGSIPKGSRVLPAEVHDGDLEDLLDRLGSEGVLQLLVEGGAEAAGSFHRAGLVNRYSIYIAPALLGGGNGRPLLAGPSSETMAEVWRGSIVGLERFGDDLRIDVSPVQ